MVTIIQVIIGILIGPLIGLILWMFLKRILIKRKKGMTVKELKKLLEKLDENQEVRFADYEDDDDEVTQFLPIHGIDNIRYKNKKMVCLYYSPEDDGLEKSTPEKTMSLN